MLGANNGGASYASWTRSHKLLLSDKDGRAAGAAAARSAPGVTRFNCTFGTCVCFLDRLRKLLNFTSGFSAVGALTVAD
jgi:hypothetical protein